MFDYLEEFVSEKPKKGNWFEPVVAKDIEDAESKLNGSFPEALKSFYQYIGKGFLRVSDSGESYDGVINRIVGPKSAVAYKLEPDTYFDNGCPEDCFPVFECGDRVYFFMRSDGKSKAVLTDSLQEVSENFESFIHSLFYDDPLFYENES